MGSIKNLFSGDTNVHMLLTNSNMAEIYVYDALKGICGATVDSIMEITNQSSFKGMLDLVNMQPLMANRWLFIIRYKSVRQLLKKYEGIFQSDTSVFLIKVEKYSEFKEVKGGFRNVNDIYLSTISRGDVNYLLHGCSLSSDMLDFVSRSYYRDPEKIFLLLKEIKSGVTISSNKDIVNICGESSGTIAKFAMMLLNEMPKSKSGMKGVLKRRIKVLSGLCETLGVRSVYNFLLSASKDFLDIKVLYLQGIIYDSVRDIPECYDETRLSKYNIYLNRITRELSYEDLLRLYIELSSCEKWRTVQDGILFMYNYYLKYANIG